MFLFVTMDLELDDWVSQAANCYTRRIFWDLFFYPKSLEIAKKKAACHLMYDAVLKSNEKRKKVQGDAVERSEYSECGTKFGTK